MKKATLCFRIYKIWQILKRFAEPEPFRPAQTLKLGGVVVHDPALKLTFFDYFF